MRNSLLLAAAIVSLSLGSVWAAERENGKEAAAETKKGKEAAPVDRDAAIAERAFATADKNKDGGLDAKELLEANRILKGALLGKKPQDLPGGRFTVEKIAEAAVKAKPEDKAAKIPKEEWLDHAKEAVSKKQAIVKEAYEKAVAQSRERGERARKDRD